MTIITRPKAPAAPEPQRRVRKPPGRVRRAADRKATRTMREAAPYAASLAAAAAAAAILRQPDIAVAGLSAAAGVAGVRLHEAFGWHRSGGKAAMRARRRYQGLATRKELRANLSPGAVAKRAPVTCPGTDPSRVPVGLGRARGQDLAGSREDSYLLVAPPRSGKALALDTPVPTPSGWTTMGELHDGDIIFGSDGSPVKVLRAWAVRHDRPCYEVEFCDGTIITADADHLWLVNTRASRMSESEQRKYRHDMPGKSQQHKRQRPQVLTTAAMAGSVRVGSDNRANYSVDVASPLSLPDAELPISPYTLGAWLGDGTSKSSVITNPDEEIIAAIEAEGWTCKRDVSPSAQRRSCPEYRIVGLQPKLRALGVLKNKHIPASYLRASEGQRRALLAGLLDTDGYCGPGTVDFSVTSERLARDFRHLAATLGYKSTLRSKPAMLYGKNCGTAWTVTIAAGADPLFWLTRKAERQAGRGAGRAASRIRQRYIADIRPVPSVPVRCITVDSPDSLYLVTEACVPTHNTGLMACWVADAPGSVLATSTRTDMYAHTAAARRDAEVWVLNPDGDGDIPSTLRWSPVDGCDDPATAIQRAGYLMDAAPRDKSGKDAWWDAKGAELLRLMLHAAAIAGADMQQVRAWVADPAHPAPAAILASEYAAPGWAHKLAALAGTDEQLNGIIASAAAALGWMDDPAMAEAACPRPGGGFDAETFLLCGHGTVYLIGADRPHGALAPYFASFAAHLFETAKRVASRSPGGRLPAPLTLALDEAAITCPVPLHKWLAEAGGHGVTVMAAVQGISQLLSRWGDHDGRTIKKLSTIKLFWGGDTDAADLEEISAVCGMRDTWDHTRNPDGSKTKTPRQERAVPPERIRKLAPGEVLILHRTTRPVVAKVTHVWDRRGYQRADVTADGAPARGAALEQAAIAAPRREAIPVPPAAPAGIGRRRPAPALDSPSGAYAVPSYPPAITEEEPAWHSTTVA